MAEITNKQTFFLGAHFERDDLPPPPYQVEVNNYILAGVAFDSSEVRRILPDGLEPNDACNGIVAMYSAPVGWAIAPFTSFYVGIEVKGHDAPDGSPAHYLVGHYDDGRAYEALRTSGPCIRPGSANIIRYGNRLIGEALSNGVIVGRMELERATETSAPPVSGTHYYLMEGWDGRMGKTAVAYTSTTDDAIVERCDISLTSENGPIDLSVRHALWGIHLPKASFVIGAFQPLDDVMSSGEGELSKIALGELLSRIGHAAALVAVDGRLLYTTPAAHELLATAQFDGHLRAWRSQDQRALEAVLTSQRTGALASETIALERPDTATPIIARVLPVAPVLTGQNAYLVLFKDASASKTANIEPLLMMCGLTAAEARLAAAIGEGHSARDCADRLGITQNTARSTLKVVYDKLGISKQTELAGIVTRLG